MLPSRSLRIALALVRGLGWRVVEAELQRPRPGPGLDELRVVGQVRLAGDHQLELDAGRQVIAHGSVLPVRAPIVRRVEVLGWLRPARTVPITRWRSTSRWSPTPSSLVVLIVGLYAFGTGEALIVQGGLGVSPWTVLAQGLSTILPVSIGVATFLVSAVVLLLWIPLRERPGLARSPTRS